MLLRRENLPQGLKPGGFLRLFGTTEVVPFQSTIYETGSSMQVIKESK